ncbi:1-acyl-sn-glycerol-3-phosphate acyltransferase, partial [Candidatus Poribacteria bacterium]|nr:1-acyl-sn-glycerol-3-phosphate acyltransferase [Candidatus Poribacteria bacterium]
MKWLNLSLQQSVKRRSVQRKIMWYTNNGFWTPRPLYRWGHRLTNIFCKGFGRLEARDVHHIPKDGGVLLVSNHVSFLDPVIVGSAANREIHFMARSNAFDIPGLGKLISMYNAYPVNRGAPDLGALRKTISLLKAGNVVLMFPEGTRSVDGTLGKARDGACFIAHRAGVPTIPVYHSGAERMLPRNSKRIRRAQLTVIFGEPLKLTAPESETKREMYQMMGNQMMEAIADLRDELLR